MIPRFRQLMRYTLWLGLAGSLPAFAAAPPLADGDLIFQTSTSAQSAAIQQATSSRWSHMGVIVHRHGKAYVLEAEATVRYTDLARWIARGEGAHYAVRRLRPPAAILTPAAEAALHGEAASMLGRRYDSAFEWSDQRLYCSELAWKLYRNAYGITLAPTSHLREFNLNQSLVRAKLQQRYHGKPPLDEPVIAPDAIFRSPLLTTIMEE